jgi:hypothetical protein
MTIAFLVMGEERKRNWYGGVLAYEFDGTLLLWQDSVTIFDNVADVIDGNSCTALFADDARYLGRWFI